MTRLFFSILLCSSLVVFSGFRSGDKALQTEKYPFSKWDQETLRKANTVAGADYMTEEEREVIRICNLARLQPKLFADTYVQKFIDDNKVKKTAYVTSLFSDLKKTKPMEAMNPQKDLFLVAQEHAIESGNKGTIGHQNYSKRFKKYASRYQNTGENCDYGNDLALDIVMSLLIDEDVPDKGHRKNILDPKFLSVGVAIRDHKKFKHNAVMCFGNIP